MSYQSEDESKIIVALDYSNIQDALNLAKQLNPSLCKLKVGLELYISYGPSIIVELHSLGYKIFLDLKLHDIPNTVMKSCITAAELGVWMLNVHSSGGKNMMSKAMQAIIQGNYKTILLGVTVLTSMDNDELHEIGYSKNISEQVLNMAELCYKSKLNGVVCSAQESKSIKNRFASNFICVCPGIRNADDKVNDQKRIMTPSSAAKNGADYIVVGRPITNSSDPLESLINIKKEFDESS